MALFNTGSARFFPTAKFPRWLPVAWKTAAREATVDHGKVVRTCATIAECRSASAS